MSVSIHDGLELGGVTSQCGGDGFAGQRRVDCAQIVAADQRRSIGLDQADGQVICSAGDGLAGVIGIGTDLGLGLDGLTRQRLHFGQAVDGTGGLRRDCAQHGSSGRIGGRGRHHAQRGQIGSGHAGGQTIAGEHLCLAGQRQQTLCRGQQAFQLGGGVHHGLAGLLVQRSLQQVQRCRKSGGIDRHPYPAEQGTERSSRGIGQRRCIGPAVDQGKELVPVVEDGLQLGGRIDLGGAKGSREQGSGGTDGLVGLDTGRHVQAHGLEVVGGGTAAVFRESAWYRLQFRIGLDLLVGRQRGGDHGLQLGEGIDVAAIVGTGADGIERRRDGGRFLGCQRTAIGAGQSQLAQFDHCQAWRVITGLGLHQDLVDQHTQRIDLGRGVDGIRQLAADDAVQQALCGGVGGLAGGGSHALHGRADGLELRRGDGRAGIGRHTIGARENGQVGVDHLLRMRRRVGLGSVDRAGAQGGIDGRHVIGRDQRRAHAAGIGHRVDQADAAVIIHRGRRGRIGGRDGVVGIEPDLGLRRVGTIDQRLQLGQGVDLGAILLAARDGRQDRRPVLRAAIGMVRHAGQAHAQLAQLNRVQRRIGYAAGRSDHQ